MSNPMMQMLGAGTASPTAGVLANVKKIKQSIEMLKNAKNPRALMMSMPGGKEAAEYIAKCGGDPRKALEQLAQERGIDIDQIMSALK